MDKDTAIQGQGTVSDDDVFLFPDEEELTLDDILGFINYHRSVLLPQYQNNKKEYKGDHAILHRDDKEAWKPDNRIVVNFPKYTVDTFNGFFNGIPVKINADNDTVNSAVNDFNNRNSLPDRLFEANKMASIYGRSYLYLYQNTNSETCVTECSPEDTFIVYGDGVDLKRRAVVRYSITKSKQMKGYWIEQDHQIEFGMTSNGIAITGHDWNFLDDVPAVEIEENTEHTAIFESVKSLYHAIEKAISEKADDNEYFADAYLAVSGAKIDTKTLNYLKQNKIINVYSDDGSLDTNNIKIEFLEKPNADGSQENLITRLTDLVFQMSMVVNINDENFGTASGVAIKYKLQPMRNLAVNKQRKVTKALRDMYQMVFANPRNVPSTLSSEWQNLNFIFTENIPANLADEATTAKNLDGIVSKETQLSTISAVDDPKTEIKRIEAEEKASMDSALKSQDSNPYDKLQPEPDDKSGE